MVNRFFVALINLLTKFSYNERSQLSCTIFCCPWSYVRAVYCNLLLFSSIIITLKYELIFTRFVKNTYLIFRLRLTRLFYSGQCHNINCIPFKKKTVYCTLKISEQIITLARNYRPWFSCLNFFLSASFSSANVAATPILSHALLHVGSNLTEKNPWRLLFLILLKNFLSKKIRLCT